jgi:hypothetical protein
MEVRLTVFGLFDVVVPSRGQYTTSFRYGILALHTITCRVHNMEK